MKVYYRLGTAEEKRLFEDFSEHFYGIVIGANLAAFYPDWLPTFLRKVRKPFFIDPVAYVFARSLENIRKETEIKKSFQKLANKYGNTLNAIIINSASPRQLIPKDFLANDKWNQNFLDELAKEVIAFKRADTFKGSQVLHAVICMLRELLLDVATHQ